ncbi:hypothetical protein FB451DRAFT_1413473 [Mycena latifolia]|nr:hypothetical protein FB451DRAFT_1413473 [Mycena latifolia]
MPHFGSSTNDNTNTFQKPHHATQLESTDYGTQPTGPGLGRTHEPRMANDPLAPSTGTVGMGEPGMGNTAAGGGRHHVRGNDGMMAGQQYGAGSGAGMPPTGAMASQNQQQPGGMTDSKALKAKAMQMEQEAQAMKIQSQELAEAERLERDAGARRERAVAHGAHPDHRHVGGLGSREPGTYN